MAEDKDRGTVVMAASALGLSMVAFVLAMAALITAVVERPAVPVAAYDPALHESALSGQSVLTPPQAPSTPPATPAGRSPIPAPGETVTKPIPAQRLTPPTTAPAPVAGQVVSWNQAEQHVGQKITVEGKIVATYNTGTVCFLNFTPYTKQSLDFCVIIFKEALNSWPEAPEKYFLNHTIRVTGTVTLHKNRPEIQVNSGSQIQRVD